MRFDLKKPCKNCPFGKAETRIRFACRERAEEIEESAYRNGFPCHLSAENIELGEDEDGYVFAGDGTTQHCAGAAGTFLNDGYDTWPGIDNDDDLGERLALQIDLSACWDSVEDFFAANEGRG